MKAGHIIILSVILVSVVGTFIATNTISGSYATITGKVVASQPKLTGLQDAVSSVLFGLVSIAAVLVVARIGQNTVEGIKESRTPNIKDTVKKAEAALEEGNHAAAYALYNTIRDMYTQLKDDEKMRHRQRIMQIHQALARQVTVAEAHYLTEKYVNNTITQEEFERLKQIVVSQ